MEPTTLTISSAQKMLRAGEITGSELTAACLAVIEAKNPTLNAFAVIGATQRVAPADGPLANIPIAIKDLIDVAGFPSAAGSPKFFGHEPALKDAFVVEKLRAAGASILGKTNTHEIALGITGINHHTGNVHNPHDPARITGGSSSGSAAAVASGMALGALGTDTGGSIRIPSALCGVVGLKPTFGRVSSRGVLPLSWNLDHIGPLAKTVEDVAILYAAIAGYDARDPNSVERDAIPFGVERDAIPFGVERDAIPFGVERDAIPLLGGRDTIPLIGGRDNIPPHRIAFAVGDYITEADPGVLEAVKNAASVFKSLGAEVVEVEIPRLREAAAANGTMVVADAAAFHRERLSEHPDWFGADIRERLERGRAVTSSEYALARRVQSEMKRYFELFFDEFDLLMLPTTAAIAAPIDGLNSAAYAPRLTRFTAPFNLTGLPALSVPCGQVDGMPVGLQLVGKAWDEATVLQAGLAFERAGKGM